MRTKTISKWVGIAAIAASAGSGLYLAYASTMNGVVEPSTNPFHPEPKDILQPIHSNVKGDEFKTRIRKERFLEQNKSNLSRWASELYTANHNRAPDAQELSNIILQAKGAWIQNNRSTDINEKSFKNSLDASISVHTSV